MGNTLLLQAGFNLYPNPGATAAASDYGKTLTTSVNLSLDGAVALGAVTTASVAAIFATMF